MHEKQSKRLAYLLRHHPEAIGLKLDEHGWGDVNYILEKEHMTRKTLEEIVKYDEKGRYSFNEDHTKIRANQGHSIPVHIEMKEVIPPDPLYHGTADRFVSSIEREGLLPMTRLYVHLSTSVEQAIKVGSRHGRPVVFLVDTRRMIDDGYVFYLSPNQIYLTKTVPAKYLTLLKK